MLLVATFFASAWSLPGFFVFNAGALAGGLLLAVWMRRWHDAHPARVEAQGGGVRRAPEINFASIPVGDNAGGLICVVGCVATLLVGVPGLVWFLVGTLAAGALMAGGLFAWHATHGSDLHSGVLTTGIDQISDGIGGANHRG
jgi:hypothetical protein